MHRKKRLIVGPVLGALIWGLFQGPISLAACQVSAQKSQCCCPVSERPSSGCCPTEKTTECPILEKSESAPTAILPTHPLISLVLAMEPVQASLIIPFPEKHAILFVQGLAPPGAPAANPALSRAPPTLA